MSIQSEANVGSRASESRRSETTADGAQTNVALAGPTTDGPSPSLVKVAYFQCWTADSYPASLIDWTATPLVAMAAVGIVDDATIDETWDGSTPVPNLISSARANGGTVLLSCVSKGAPTNWGEAIATATLRRRLVSNIVAIVGRDGYDGVDLDWEYPSTAKHRADFTAFVQLLRAALGAKMLTIAIIGSEQADFFDLPVLDRSVDAWHLMGYTLGVGTGYAGYNAPLDADTQTYTVEGAFTYLAARNLGTAKVVLLLPAFGVRYSTVNAPLAPTNDSVAEPSYAEIAPLVNDGAWVRHWATVGSVPYLLREDGQDGFITYDDAASWQVKIAYALAQGCCGVGFWALGKDRLPDTTEPLRDLIKATSRRNSVLFD